MNYFTFRELCKSDTAEDCGIQNIPDDQSLQNLLEITRPQLNIVREFLGCPLFVTNAYRKPEVNKLVGGVSTSAHIRGLAADIYSTKMTVQEAFEKLKKADFPFMDQCILYRSKNFIHIGFTETNKKPRKMYFEK